MHFERMVTWDRRQSGTSSPSSERQRQTMKANFPGSMTLLCVVPDCHLTVSQSILILVKTNLLWN